MVDAVGSLFDDAILQSPGFKAGGLKVDVGRVDAGPQKVLHHPVKV